MDLNTVVAGWSCNRAQPMPTKGQRAEDAYFASHSFDWPLHWQVVGNRIADIFRVLRAIRLPASFPQLHGVR